MSEGLIIYPFPIREGTIGRFFLPGNLTMKEVARINEFLKTLAVDNPTFDAAEAARLQSNMRQE